MKKRFKYAIGFVLTIACLIGCSACSILFPDYDFDDPAGVWSCRYLPNSNKTECQIRGWLPEYQQTHEYLDYAFFPSYIGEVKVKEVGILALMGSPAGGSYEGKGKLFIPYTAEIVVLEGACYMISGTDFDGNNSAYGRFNAKMYVPNEYYEMYCEKKPDEEFYKANVVYDINYENPDYQYYCVDYCSYSLTAEQVQFIKTQGTSRVVSPGDDSNEYPTKNKEYRRYNYGKDKWNIIDGWEKDAEGNEIYTSKIEIIPPAPEREGYTFGGWYKEKECINKWNFETDTLPQLRLDENNEILFQETALYAKWNKEG